jgi:FixJ family two-component response regulator
MVSEGSLYGWNNDAGAGRSTTKAKNIFYADGDMKSTEAVRAILRQTGASVTQFKGIRDCLASISRGNCHLLISNAPQPAVEGIELLAKTTRIAPWLPVIVLVDRGQIRTAVRVIKAGAIDCIERPPQPHRLRSAIDAVLRRPTPDPKRRPLTEVETSVLQHILRGHTNRQIAAILRRSQRTVEVHRSDIMRKLRVNGPVDLMRKAAAIGLIEL